MKHVIKEYKGKEEESEKLRIISKAKRILLKACDDGLRNSTQETINTFVLDEERGLAELSEDEVHEEACVMFMDGFTDRDSDLFFVGDRFLALKFLGARLDLQCNTEAHYVRMLGMFGTEAVENDKYDCMFREVESLTKQDLASLWLRFPEELENSTRRAVLQRDVEVPTTHRQVLSLSGVIANGYLTWSAVDSFRENSAPGEREKGLTSDLVERMMNFGLSKDEESRMSIMLIERLIEDVKEIRKGVTASLYVSAIWNLS